MRMDDLSAYTVLFDLSTRAYQPPWFSLIVLMHFAFAAAAMYAARGARATNRGGGRLLLCFDFCADHNLGSLV
ncbi:MAG: hypothetical protein NVV62_04915 [Terricaulis sp.]|nr:hypothetical protein [Terricaulis sp.]